MENYLQAHDYGNYNNLLTDDEARRVAGDLLHTYGETPEGIPETRYSKNLRTMIEDIMSRHLRDHWTSPRFVGAGNGLQGFGELSG